MLPKSLLTPLLVKPGTDAKLHKRETGWAWTETLRDADKGAVKEQARNQLEQNVAELTRVQDCSYAIKKYALLLVLQGMDAAGKDGTIKHVMSSLNPQGCRVESFKQPTDEERAHDFLWRYVCRLPPRGMIGIFNRSYYEDVLVGRVHPEQLGELLPGSPNKQKKFWQRGYESINALEKHLTLNGTQIIKVFLHISKREQKERLLARLDDPTKHWKFSPADLAERPHWSAYRDAFEDALTATSTKQAPWWVV